MKKVTLFLLMAATSSCSFNKLYYRPQKLDNDIHLIHAYDDVRKDSLLMRLDGEDHQLSFTGSDGTPKTGSFTVESGMIKSRSGNRLYGVFLKPNKMLEPQVTLLFLHGNAGNFLSQWGLCTPLVKAGMQAYLVDYSGYGFSTGRPTRKKMLQDAQAALDHILARPDVKNTRVVIYGQSMGGLIGAELAAGNEILVDGLVIEGAPASHKSIGAHFMPRAKFLAKLFVRERYSTVKSVRGFHKPVLVIHSSEDVVAPPEMGRSIYKNANAPKYYYEVKHPHVYAPMFYADSIVYKIHSMLQTR